MQIQLKQAIRAQGKQHRPPAIVDTAEIGISDADAQVLVTQGVAVIVAPEVEQTEGQAEVEQTETEKPAAKPAKAKK